MNNLQTIIFNSKSNNYFMLSNFYGGSEIYYMKDRFNDSEVKKLFDVFEVCDEDTFIYYLKVLQPTKKWNKVKLDYWFKFINGEKIPIRGILAKLVGTSVKNTTTGRKRLKILKELTGLKEISINAELSSLDKKNLMLDCLRKKFSKEKYKQALLSTGHAILHEKPMRGKGDNWTYPGNDWLGELLMKVRSDINII